MVEKLFFVFRAVLEFLPAGFCPFDKLLGWLPVC